MKVRSSRIFQLLSIFVLSTIVTVPQDVLAQDHVVSSSDIQKTSHLLRLLVKNIWRK